MFSKNKMYTYIESNVGDMYLTANTYKFPFKQIT